jgi:hypothetical protein
MACDSPGWPGDIPPTKKMDLVICSGKRSVANKMMRIKDVLRDLERMNVNAKDNSEKSQN